MKGEIKVDIKTETDKLRKALLDNAKLQLELGLIVPDEYYNQIKDDINSKISLLPATS